MQESVSLVPLGVADYARAKSFYEAMGWSAALDGGYAGAFRDLDGHAREVAHNPGFGSNEDGSVRLPAADS